ncbi:U3 snoRNP protein [Yamadazyma tenuis]|uniref:U3 small nucleolar RNA-associated protein 6 N-terminal domain-containing protein n=1 Tax=Candida tenuis (strain ATCC 10573 / BCRC 21748 / CBS 615 / JCM 9827 / NBRC 10315 / NRRL Y-1498 / VKM Y-70) TaxID=590646 RepID=G3B365_CANTC|nr:uncharacterized protein CANTEDRAFT_114132 [Yamadazyma tenuis ATCC 10573]XP_006686676.1 uncharacterized protein CANTEDRAFT_114132 [Yamadazyma tenuis ATCC 10573]EGV64361.1 hypothetical protein CANTEDRAFT_114132 [Yamadazyma tenuis ATCC 10573]EGV64362.1 hypothetical protein CANTEDRAFT_114132 [Yamadazyma tenuis ATCC 10573]WEJ96274.1 U3 snoRNP protein [Yamadazyma tenuis]
MAEKVRYYLEQAVPELEDLQKKGLFEKHEITMIMRRRTDFEHRIQGRGSTTRDFIKYSEFERNLEKLRKKRYTRLGKAGLVDTKPSISDWAGVRRILFVYQRGTYKYPKNLELWAQYLDFAKKNGAIKVVYKIYSRLLQLQPRNVDAWLSSAKYEFEINNNAKGSRVLFQRALRLNPESSELWLNYFQFELTYVSKLLTRRKVLGLLTEGQQREQMEKEVKEYHDKLNQDNALNGDGQDDNEIALPTEELRDELNTLPEADMNMLGNPETNPALKGDVALAIFDASLPELIKPKLFKRVEKLFVLINRFLDIIDKFDDLNQDYLYLHVLSMLQSEYPHELNTALIDITLPIRTVSRNEPDFAANLQLSVNKFMAYKLKTEGLEKSELVKAYVNYLEKFVEGDDGLMRAIIKKCRD